MAKKTTHFGYQEVPVDEKVKKVGEVFHSVAEKYDLMNDLMSLGMHRLWKRFAVELCALRPEHKVLDLAAGTGDLAKRMAPLLGEKGQLILSDINDAMLNLGRENMVDAGLTGPINYVQANAEKLPFPSDYFDCVTIGFGLRNVTEKENALTEMYRVLKPGGRVLVLEFSKPTTSLLEKIYDTYSFSVLPALGRWIARDEKSYRYLAESIRKHPDQHTLKTMMEGSGFESCDVHNLTGGVVAIHRGFKS